MGMGYPYIFALDSPSLIGYKRRMTQYGNIGEIWRFDPPRWDRKLGIQHFLITDVVRSPYRDIHYVCIQLETGETVPDLLIDEANIKNYNARKVA